MLSSVLHNFFKCILKIISEVKYIGMCNNWIKKWGNYHYVLFRVLIGGGFLMHRYSKPWGPKAVGSLVSLFGIAGVVEVLVGLAILVGFFTRLAAFGGTITMVVALIKVHFPQGLNPLANGGELAVLYLAAFLVLMLYGNGIWSLEKSLLEKETF